jgi:hypothetical protein
MSVRPHVFPITPSLSGSDGELVSVHVYTEPRRLEKVLEALARLPFPINPQIYHQAGIGYVYGDGREERKNLTIVEFPAFSEQLATVRETLKKTGLPPSMAHVRSMLDNIHADHCSEIAPNGAPYAAVKYYKHLPG